MISFDDATAVLRKWVDEKRELRFDAEFTDRRYTFSVEGTLESADGGMLKFRVGDRGFISIYLPPNTEFEYVDPDTMRAPLKDRKTEGYKGGPILCGAAVFARVPENSKLMLIEVDS